MKTKQKEVVPNKSLVHDARETIRAINHGVRQIIMRYVIANPGCQVNAIYKTLGLEQSITSTFVHLLEDVAIVHLEDDGRCVKVKVDDEKLKNVYQWINNLYAIMQQHLIETKFYLTKKVTQQNLKIHNVSVSEKAVRSVAHLLNALDNQEQRKILSILLEHDSPLTVTDLYIKARTEQAATSHHLSLMKKVGLVSAHREGKHILYQPNRQYCTMVQNYIDTIPCPCGNGNKAKASACGGFFSSPSKSRT